MYRSLLLYFYRFTVSIKLVLELCLLCVCVDDLLFSFVFAICDDDALCCHSFIHSAVCLPLAKACSSCFFHLSLFIALFVFLYPPTNHLNFREEASIQTQQRQTSSNDVFSPVMLVEYFENEIKKI